MRRRTLLRGFTLGELIAVVTVIMILGALLLSWIVDQRERSRRADRIRCISNLKLVGLSFRIFATDNNDQYPGALLATNEAVRGSVTAVDIFRSLSNELSTPKLIVCPADTKKEATNFASLSALNISYFASLSASETNPTAFLAGDRNVMVDGRLGAGLVKLTTNAVVGWSAELHNGQGNICMADGSVQQFSSNRLKHELRTQPIGTNYLVFP